MPEGHPARNAAAALGAQIGVIVSDTPAASILEETEPEDVQEMAAPRRVRVSRPSRERGKYAMAWPVRNVITSNYGYRRSGFHHGIDVRCWYGTPIRAAKGGKVVYSGWLRPYGRTLIIQHSHGFRTLYGHLNSWGTSRGRWVGPDQIIGYCGSTGNSTGPHLHFEIYRWGRVLNPNTMLPR